MKGKEVINELKSSFSKIKKNYKELKKLYSQGEDVIPSAQWLLDNIYLIEKEYKAIRHNMPRDYFESLPYMPETSCCEIQRIYYYSKEYLKKHKLKISQEGVISFIKSKEERFSMGELWAFPLSLRINIIISLSKCSNKILEIEKSKVYGKELAFRVIRCLEDNKKDDGLVILKEGFRDYEVIDKKILIETLRDNSVEDKDIYIAIKEEALKNNEGHVVEHLEEEIELLIQALRGIEGLNWRKFFDETSIIEEMLRKDPSGTYPNMDFSSKDYYRHKVEELSKKYQRDEFVIAEKIVYLAKRAKEEGRRDYRSHIGYYLIDNGLAELGEEINNNKRTSPYFSQGVFVALNIIGTLLVTFLGIGMSLMLGGGYLPLLLMIIPASEVIVAWVNFWACHFKGIRKVPKLDYSKGIPENKKTIVVIPAILPSKERTLELMKSLEVYYLGNKDKNVYFALLGDFVDSKEEKLENDKEIIQEGFKEALRLNKEYFNGEKHFFFLSRKKLYNPKEGVYMGYERKRGKLMEFMKAIRGSQEHSFNVISSYIGELKDLKYLITLDEDTFMPRDGVRKLVGAMAHILNRASVKKGKVVHGYGIMQPKVSISLESKNASDFAKIFAGDAGVDGYSVAYSDTYEDLFGEGTFTGKGIIEIDTFLEVMEGEVPENSMLSHDLIEGAMCKCSLLSDVEVIDNYPSTYLGSCKRLHRWVRGDWQNISYIFSKKISLISKWKIIDNLRRSLLAPSLILAVTLNLLILSGGNEGAMLIFLGIITPFLFTVTDFVVTPKNLVQGTVKTLKQIVLIISFIPYQGYVMTSAILKALFRMIISKRHKLEWVPQSILDGKASNNLMYYFRKMWFSIFFGVFVLYRVLDEALIMGVINIPLGALWVISPVIAHYISLGNEKEKLRLEKEDRVFLRENARRIWAYYEDFVNEENHYLAPDNYQEKPYKGVAHRTSPTNIAMGITSNIVAYDLGYLNLSKTVGKIENIIEGMKELEKYKGHYYNWYDTRTLRPLYPRYISTVDSGNLLSYLMIALESLKEMKKKPLIRREELLAIKDTLRIMGNKELLNIPIDLPFKEYKTYSLMILENLKLLEEDYWRDKAINEIKNKLDFYDVILGAYVKFGENKSLEELIYDLEDNEEGYEDELITLKSLMEKINKLIADINNIVEEMKFKFLYKEERGLFSIGYNLEEDSLSQSYYDLLASEARTTSFLTIARGEVPTSHWFKLNRSLTNGYGGKTLVSWSGTMFEYFMPELIMKSYDNTLLEESYKSVMHGQRTYCKKRGVPYGISESGYFLFDVNENYQYKAFGVPKIGLKNGLEDELVISPYSTLMSLSFGGEEGIENLKKLKEIGAFGRYGFMEAIDYKIDGEGKLQGRLIDSYMVHHLGMSLMGLDNVLKDNIFQRRFHSIPLVKSTELLLKEKLPQKIVYEREEELVFRSGEVQGEYLVPRIYKGAIYNNPEILLLSNGSYSSMISTTGSGYGKRENTTVYRWKGDSTSDSSGMFIYLKDKKDKNFYSATYEPCKNQGEDYKVELSLSKAVFSRKDNNIKTTMELTLALEDDIEIRKISLENIGEETKDIEISSYLEITMQSFQGDVVHPGFSNLFISTEYYEEEKLLLGNRRARAKGEKSPYIFHKVIGEEGPISFETSRVNFIGRNRDLASPKAMDENNIYENTIGTVLDPILSLRCDINIKPKEKKEIYFIVGVCNSKEEAIELSKEYGNTTQLERAFNLYYRYVLLQLKSLGIKSTQGNIYQSLSSYILYLHSGRKDREKYIKNISKHQSDLWSYGISGDMPIALGVINNEEDLDLARALIKMHGYFRDLGLYIDLVLYNNEEASYDKPMEKSILTLINSAKHRDVLNIKGGIFLHNKATMDEKMKEFLIGIADIYVEGEKGSILTQVKEIYNHYENKTLNRRKIKVIPSQLQADVSEGEINDLDFYNGYGGFDPRDKSYVIKLSKNKNTPAPWINVICNKNFGFHVSEVGSTYTWCGNSRENKITPWSNDWVCDPLMEGLYIRDDKRKESFSITPKPIRDNGEYKIRHSFGYSTFTHSALGVKGVQTLFCPLEENLKIVKVEVENEEDIEKNLSLFYYGELVLGVYSYGSNKYISTALEKDYIYGSNPYSKEFGKLKSYLTMVGAEDLTFTGDKKEFIGIGGEMCNPSALDKENLSNKVGGIYDPCLAVKGKIKLKPYEKKEVLILLGAEESSEKIEEVLNKYKYVENSKKELEKLQEYWSYFLGNIQVETKDKSLDYMLNGWLLYQTYSCRYLSRTAFYQSGGAYGFRDQLQDSMNLGIVAPEISKEQIKKNAERQYIEGDVQHWWHPVVNSGIRTRFSDDLLWLPYAVTVYIKRTGDYSICLEKASYLVDEPLREGEDERYTIVNSFSEEYTIYDHCLRALRKGLNYGEHNIPLMGSGDWNDGMSTVGNKGAGESVWLGWFLYDILNDFKEVSKYFRDDENYEYFHKEQDFIKKNLEKNAWDGDWYRRAYFDDGTPLGSKENDECKIDSLAQSWAVISKGGNKERSILAMDMVDKYLVKEESGIILLLYPPFNKSDLEPGYIKGYVPGVRENGGQYTHAAVWVILALAKLGLHDKAYKYYDMINPINHSLNEEDCNVYKTEPYVMAADVYLKEPHRGRGGWSWYTGASGWMYKVGIEDIIGLKHLQGRGYAIEPSMPSSWDDYKIFIKNENENYEIRVKRGEKNRILINGKEEEFIPKDGGELIIEVEIGNKF